MPQVDTEFELSKRRGRTALLRSRKLRPKGMGPELASAGSCRQGSSMFANPEASVASSDSVPAPTSRQSHRLVAVTVYWRPGGAKAPREWELGPRHAEEGEPLVGGSRDGVDRVWAWLYYIPALK